MRSATMISYLSTILSNRELVCSFEVVLSLDQEGVMNLGQGTSAGIGE